MINTYSDQQNPCTFCGKDDDNLTTNDNNNECLEFSLCGNDTTLFVREVSVEDFAKPKEDEIRIEEESEITGSQVPQVVSSHNIMSTPSSKFGKKSSKDGRESHTQEYNALNTKKWSGNTYFEEAIRKLREQQYEKESRKAIKMRKLWHKFEKEILKDRRRDLITSSGPEWWQEPSRKQIVLATTLKEVIKADYEEEVTGRTRQWLLDLGITARLTPKNVRKCMKLSMLEPVDFLLETHSVIVKSQLNIKKKGELQRPFSVDERLLLSAVCVLQLPTLLTMLDYIFPPPKPYPADKRIQELLFGNLNDESIRYATPYMEPLPFRNKLDFEDWAFGKIFSALLPMILRDEDEGPTNSRTTFIKKKTSEIRQSIGRVSPPLPQVNRISNFSTTPSIALLLSYCLSKRQISDSMRVNVDDDSDHRKTFGRRLTTIGRAQGQTKQIEFSLKSDTNTNPRQVSSRSVETESHSAMGVDTLCSLKKERLSPTVLREENEELLWVNQPAQEELPQKFVPPQGKDTVPPPYPASPPYYDFDQYDQPTDHTGRKLTYTRSETGLGSTSKDVRTESKLKRADPDYTRTVTEISRITTGDTRSYVEGGSLKSFDKEQDGSESLHQQLIHVWEEIEVYPEKEQLQQAIKVLKGMGDPLAQLPRVHELPAIQRWFELRHGKNRILTKQAKEDLLRRSRGMWKSVHFASSTRGPKVDITKREERKLTWSKKKWLQSEVRKETQNYFSRIKEEKVDNARVFFPSMLNHYDYGSKLNRNFRDVYFTYLPAREADAFVYRPWQPQETKSSSK